MAYDNTTLYPNPGSGLGFKSDSTPGGRVGTTKLLDPTAGSEDPIGNAAFPLHVQGAQIGATNSGVAATDNENTGLNGLIKRVCALLSYLISLYPTALGVRNGFRISHAGYLNAAWNEHGNKAGAANTRAIATRAASGVAGIRNVCTSFAATVSFATAPGAAASFLFVIRDGAAGSGNVIWSETCAVQNVDGAWAAIHNPPGFWLEGTPDTAMVGEFITGPGANGVQVVSLQGTTST